MARGGGGKWAGHVGGAPYVYVPPGSSGGGGAPSWVPANAKIHIDFVGGSPQGRAYAAGAEVAIDTLLGSDPNTENGWDVTAYDPSKLTPDGYLGPMDNPVALIGDAQARITSNSGATLTFGFKQVGSDPPGDPVFVIVSADGNDALENKLNPVSTNVSMLSWNGEPTISINSVLVAGDGVRNKAALTITDTRFEGAFNGSAAAEYTITEAGRPPSNPLVAVVLDITGIGEALQSITIYDPLPDTTGLSDLSNL